MINNIVNNADGSYQKNELIYSEDIKSGCVGNTWINIKVFSSKAYMPNHELDCTPYSLEITFSGRINTDSYMTFNLPWSEPEDIKQMGEALIRASEKLREVSDAKLDKA